MAQAKPQRVEIGFSGGQVIAVKLTPADLKDLTKALSTGQGWFELSADDGTVALDAGEVVFVRVAESDQTIGFGG